MAQGISSSLNLTLARLNSIENNFNALKSIGLYSAYKTDGTKEVSSSPVFQEILDNKLQNQNEEISNEIINTIEENLPEDILPLKKEGITLKSKLDLTSQKYDIDELISTLSDKYNLDSDFIKAIIKQESGFKTKAVSKKGAMGLMQLMPSTAKAMGVKDAYDAAQNLEGGIKYLKGLMDRFDNNEKLVLAAYNAGPNAVKRYGGIPPYKETQNYVNNIMSNYNKIKGARQ